MTTLTPRPICCEGVIARRQGNEGMHVRGKQS